MNAGPDQWFLHRDGKNYGPFPVADLRRWAAAGKIGPNNMVCRNGDAEWVRLADTGMLPPHAVAGPPPEPKPAPVPKPALRSEQREDGPYLGAAVAKKHIRQACTELFLPGERIMAMIPGQVREGADRAGGKFKFTSSSNKGSTFTNHYCIVTDRRVILWARGLLSGSTDAFDLADVRSVELQTGVMLAALVFNVGRLECFANVRKGEAKRVCEIVRGMIGRAARGGAGDAGGGGGADMAGQLKQLADLHAAGALSAEEFEAAKRRVLDS